MAYKDKKESKKPKVRPKLDTATKRLMVACLLRYDKAMRAVLPFLKVEDFRESEKTYALLWKIASKAYKENSVLPDRDIMRAEVKDVLKNTPDYFTIEERQELSRFLKFAYNDKFKETDPEKAEEKIRWATSTLKLFLEERIAEQVKENLSANRILPSDFLSMMEGATKRAGQVKVLTPAKIEPLFPEDWEPKGINLRKTGMVFDLFFGGGEAPGELYGFLAPYGSCKTLMGVQKCVDGAIAEGAMNRAETGDGVFRPQFFFSYEAPVADELRFRTLAYAAKVPRSRLESMTSWKDLSTSSDLSTLQPYEKKRYKDHLAAGKEIPGELERVRHYMTSLNDYLVFVDMSSFSEQSDSSVGSGGVSEIQMILESRCEELERILKPKGYKAVEPYQVWVDYLGLLTSRYMNANNIEYGELRHYLKSMMADCKRLIARPFNCPVYVNHQLSGEANARRAGTVSKHTDAAESKSFAENADFCVCVGVPQMMPEDKTEEVYLDMEGNQVRQVRQLCIFNCSKHRRSPPTHSEVVMIDGTYSRISNEDLDYVVDPIRNRITEKSNWQAVNEGSANAHGKSSNGGDQGIKIPQETNPAVRKLKNVGSAYGAEPE